MGVLINGCVFTQAAGYLGLHEKNGIDSRLRT
jgi:hypothetical protein